MKILSAEPSKNYVVRARESEGAVSDLYIRSSAEDWDVLKDGEMAKVIDCEELEQQFQQFIRRQENEVRG